MDEIRISEYWKSFKELVMYMAPDGDFTAADVRDCFDGELKENEANSLVLYGTLYTLVEEGWLLLKVDGNLTVFRRRYQSEGAGVSTSSAEPDKARSTQLESIARDSKQLAEEVEDDGDDDAFFMRRLY